MDSSDLHMVLSLGIWVMTSKVGRRNFERLGWLPSFDVRNGAPCNNMAQKMARYPLTDSFFAFFKRIEQ